MLVDQENVFEIEWKSTCDEKSSLIVQTFCKSSKYLFVYHEYPGNNTWNDTSTENSQNRAEVLN